MLPTIATLLCACSFCLLYHASVRAEVPRSYLRTFARGNNKLIRLISVLLLIASFLLFGFHFGAAAGTIIAVVLLMTVACLIILFMPLLNNRR